MGYRSCGNCSNKTCEKMIKLYREYCINTKFEKYWQKIPCPSCKGVLSEIRYHNGRKLRHCYSCHLNFYEED